MKHQLEKALRLAKKTGDRLILFDSSKPDYSVVVMGLDEYERIIDRNADVRGLTEDELLDRINRDIAIWKSEQDDSELVDFAPRYHDTFEPLDLYRSYSDRSLDWREVDRDPDLAIGRSDVWEPENSDFSFGSKHSSGERKNEGFDQVLQASSELNKRRGWRIPEERKERAEEVIEEDRQYLEELPF